MFILGRILLSPFGAKQKLHSPISFIRNTGKAPILMSMCLSLIFQFILDLGGEERYISH